MPKGSRGGGGGKRRETTRFAAENDFTVYDSSDRLKKGVANSLTGVKRLNAMPIEDDLAWFEKDIDQLDALIPCSELEAQFADEDTGIKNAASFRRRKKKLQALSVSTDTGLVYPLDLWYMLSQYISPGQIGTFACVCQGSNMVVHTVSFWKQLYMRYYTNIPDLSKDLVPEMIERNHGLRSRVIRALYCMYQPLAERVKNITIFEDEPHDLVGMRCLLMWQQTNKNMWNFCFKLRKERLLPLPLTTATSSSSSQSGLSNCHQSFWNTSISDAPIRSSDLLNGYNDIYHNPENNCCILQVTCQNFISTQPVMGLILTNVHLNVTSDMRYHKLRLSFDSKIHERTDTSVHGGRRNVCYAGQLVLLDPVVNLRVINWWDPKYQQIMKSNFNQTVNDRYDA